MIANANLYFHWRQQCRERNTLLTTGQTDKNWTAKIDCSKGQLYRPRPKYSIYRGDNTNRR